MENTLFVGVRYKAEVMSSVEDNKSIWEALRRAPGGGHLGPRFRESPRGPEILGG